MPDKVVNLGVYRLTKAASRVKGLFEERFGCDFGPHTRFQDLDDIPLSFLIQGKDQANEFIHDFIIKLLDLDRKAGFHYLEKNDKMVVLDSYLFLLDQFRFEAMARLGWVSSYPAQAFPVVLAVLKPELVKSQGQDLELSSDHINYEEFNLRRNLDGEVVIRRLIPEAIELFNKLKNLS